MQRLDPRCTFSSPPGMQCDSGEGAGVICDIRDPVVVAMEQVSTYKYKYKYKYKYRFVSSRVSPTLEFP